MSLSRRPRARNDRVGRPHGHRQRQAVQAARRRCQHDAHASAAARSISTAAQRAPAQLARPRSSRTTGEAAINLDLPISRRNRDFSALGNLTLNANAEVNQLSDFGTLTKLGAGANWSPVDRLNFITSWTREEGPPTINQLGDPVLETPGSRIFDFTTGQTVLVDRDHRRQSGPPGRPAQRVEARRQLAAVREDRPSPARRLRPPDDRPADLEHHRDARRSRRRFPTASCAIRRASWSASTCARSISTARASDTLRLGFDFSKPLKSKRPSQSVIDQIRAQFGFGAARGRLRRARRRPARAALRRAPPKACPRRRHAARRRWRRRSGRRWRRRARRRRRLLRAAAEPRPAAFLADRHHHLRRQGHDRARPAGLDYLHGDAAGSAAGRRATRSRRRPAGSTTASARGSAPTGAAATTVNTLTGDDLRFSPLATFDLRLFANPGDIPEIALKHPWLRGTQVRLEVNNLFNSRPKVRDAPATCRSIISRTCSTRSGRTIMISFRKLFLPPPASSASSANSEQQQQAQPRRRADSAFREIVLKRAAMTPVQPVRGTQSLLGEDADRLAAVVAAFDGAPPVRLQAGRGADDRADAGVRAHHRRDHRRRLQGNVFVRGPRRRIDHAPARVHRRHLPRLSERGLAAARAAEDRDPRLGVPLRAAAKGPLPRIPPARRRDHRRRRAPGRRRDARLGRSAAGRARHRTARPRAEHARRSRNPRRLARRTASTISGP